MRAAGVRYRARVGVKPKALEIEAVEIHYRVHAAALKWMLANEHATSAEMRRVCSLLEQFRYHGVCLPAANTAGIFIGDPEIRLCVVDLIEQVHSS